MFFNTNVIKFLSPETLPWIHDPIAKRAGQHDSAYKIACIDTEMQVFLRLMFDRKGLMSFGFRIMESADKISGLRFALLIVLLSGFMVLPLRFRV